MTHTGRPEPDASARPLRQFDPLLRTAADAVPDGILVVDDSGTIVLANLSAQHLFGYGPDEFVGLDAKAVLPGPGAGEHLARRKDGSEFPAEVRLNPIVTPTGRLVVNSVADITKRRVLQEAHERSLEDRLAFLALIGDTAAAFVNLGPKEVDQAITNALQRICETLDLDRAVLFLRTSGGVDDFQPAHRWARGGPEPPAGGLSTREYFPWMHERLLQGEHVAYVRVEDIPDPRSQSSIRRFGARSGCSLPFSIDGQVAGIVAFASLHDERPWPDHLVGRLRLATRIFANAIRRKRDDEALASAMAEVHRLSERLRDENVYLRQEVSRDLGLVVGQSAAITGVLEQVQQVAPTDSNVLLLGETGSGKELIATQVHALSPRRDRLMVRVNCAAIPSALIESELFGREKGAYTGALTRQTGRFELADRSTIFLDEIGNLPLDVQVKLLRVIEDRHVDRLGGNRPVKVDVRIIAATHRNLEEMVAQGTFREDLYYRLNVFPIRVPPLRERPDDIPILVWRFVEEFSKRFGKTIDSIAKDSMSALQHYARPGNVRELRNVVERAMIVTKPGKLSIALPQPTGKTAASAGTQTLRDMEVAHVTQVLNATGWRIRGAGGAAERLGLKPSTLETRMAKLGIRRPAKA